MAEGLHGERIEISEEESDAEKDGEQVGHEQPQRRKPFEGEGQRPRNHRAQCDGHRRRPREPAHAMLQHEAAVHERGAADGKRQRSEIEREQRAGPVGLLEYLLGRAQVGDERRVHASGGECISERGPNPQDFQDGSADGPGGKGPPTISGQGFRLAQCKPCECDGGDGEEGGEYRAPAAQPQDPLSKGRGDGGNEDEYGHGEGHETSHLASFVLIAHQGHGHDTRSRDSEPLQDTARYHHLECGCEDAHETSGHEQDEARIDSGLASDAVG